MEAEPIQGDSSPVTEEDTRKRGIVSDLILAENKSMVDFAKHLVTVSFSAVGVIVTLKSNWLAQATNAHRTTILLVVAIVLFLAAVVVSSAAIKVQRLRVSGVDYGDVERELGRIARGRYRLTLVAAALCVAAVALVAVAVL